MISILGGMMAELTLTLPLTDETTIKYRQRTFVIILLIVLFSAACNSKNRPILDSAEIDTPTATIRIREFQEKRFPLSKFSYVFEAKPSGSAEWTLIMSATADDSIPVPRDQVRVISKEATYVFMEEKYAVTTNGARSWYVWNANDAIRNVEYPSQFFISEVSVNPDGTGTLTAVPRSKDRQILQLRTDDFGRSWRQ